MDTMRKLKLGRLAVWHHPGPQAQRVILAHGTNEHSGRHINHIQFFAELGIDLVRFDFRGHGQSDGARQWIESFADYVEDLDAVAGWAKASIEPKPTIFVGHSLGALVAAHLLADRPDYAAGLVADGGAFGPSPHVSPLLMKFFLLAARLAPRLRIPRALKSEHLSTDAAVVRSHREDPLVGPNTPVWQGAEVIRAFTSVRQAMTRLQLPLLFLHGDADPITSAAIAAECLALAPARDKTLKLYKGGYHELHNDVVKELYFKDLAQWLTTHM